MKVPQGFAYISTTLKGVIAQYMNDRDKDFALQCFKHWCSQCKNMIRATPHEPESIAYTLHSVIDDRIADMRAKSVMGRHIQCRKGCAACCHMSVDVFPQEAALLHRIAQEKGIKLDRDKLKRQAEKDSATWRHLAPEDQACPFLSEDRACRVHEHRPAACRKHHVKTDPDLCDSMKHPGAQVGMVFDIEAEIIASAAMTTYGVGTMAQMLLENEPEVAR